MHMIIMINEHEGTQEWMCFSCGRHLLVSWEPTFEKTVLVEGDPSAKHTGLKNHMRAEGGLERPANLLSGPVGESVEEARLKPWVMWMDEIGFEKYWDRDLK